MGKWRSGDWLVHFTHWKSDHGYQWEPPAPVYRISYMGGESTEVMETRANGEIVKRVTREVIDIQARDISPQHRLGVAWHPGRWDHEEAKHWPKDSRTSWSGANMARNALRDFRRLAQNRIPFRNFRSDLQGPDEGRYERQQAFVTERRDQMLVYANKYGLLWGDNDPRSLNDWEEECADFISADTLATWIRLAKRGQGKSGYSREGKIASEAINAYRAIRQDVNEIERGNPKGAIVAHPNFTAHHNYLHVDLTAYGGKRVHVRDPDVRVLDPDTGEVIERINLESIRAQSDVDQMWEIFTQIVGPKMKGGLSLAVGDSPTSGAGIVNSQLVHMLYLRLWLDVVEAKPVPKRCAECGDDIDEGNRNRTYCSDACRQRAYRNRTAARNHT